MTHHHSIFTLIIKISFSKIWRLLAWSSWTCFSHAVQVKSQPLVIVIVWSPLKSSSRATISKHNLNSLLSMRVGLTAVEGAAPAELERQPLPLCTHCTDHNHTQGGRCRGRRCRRWRSGDEGWHAHEVGEEGHQAQNARVQNYRQLNSTNVLRYWNLYGLITCE